MTPLRHCADCNSEPQEEQGALRLIDGVGSACDPLYSGVVEIFNAGRWGAVCRNGRVDAITADVVCRQLGFAQGTPVNGGEPEVDNFAEESEVPSDTTWLAGVRCRGHEATLTDCLGNDDGGFLDGSGGNICSRRLHVACRQFAVEEALEQPAPAAGEHRSAVEITNFRWSCTVRHISTLLATSLPNADWSRRDDNKQDVQMRHRT